MGNPDEVELPSHSAPACFYIDRTGARRLGPFDIGLEFNDERAAVAVDNRWHILTPTGELTALDPTFRWLKPLSSRRFLVRRTFEATSGLLVDDAGQVLRAGLVDVHRFDGEHAAFAEKGHLEELMPRHPVHVGESWGLLDRSGKAVLAPTWASVKPPRDGRVLVCEGQVSVWGVRGQWRYLDTAFASAFPSDFSMASSFSEGLAGVRDAGGAHLVDPNGVRVLTLSEVDFIESPQGGVCRVSLGHRSQSWFRLMTVAGEWLTEASSWLFWNGTAGVGALGASRQGVASASRGYLVDWRTVREADFKTDFQFVGFSEGLVPVSVKGGATYFTPDGLRPIDRCFAMARSFSAGLAPVREGRSMMASLGLVEKTPSKEPTARKPAAKKPTVRKAAVRKPAVRKPAGPKR